MQCNPVLSIDAPVLQPHK